MILQGVGHPVPYLGVSYANDPQKGGYMAYAPALDLTTLFEVILPSGKPPSLTAVHHLLESLGSDNYCENGIFVALPFIGTNDKCDQHVLGCNLAHVCCNRVCVV